MSADYSISAVERIVNNNFESETLIRAS